ncbi:MAG: phenylalanine--tRNA ligase subunit alpha, partial [Aquificaceae bacterium]
MDIKDLEEDLKKEVLGVKTLQELQQVKAKYLGKEGKISRAIANIKNVPPEQRKDYGLRANKLKEYAEELIRQKEEEIKRLELQEKLAKEWMDLSVPLEPAYGTYHPLAQTLKRIEEIFLSMGFSLMEG